ncbi:MAG: TAT-variant-translocated molybdopterin oxidoreductase [Planctomycetes bacterium]|nr:TAT-variant-translocated molybdopterin oxidoreductase [Planctomycetota bacterium]
MSDVIIPDSGTSGTRHWRSLEQLQAEDSAEFQEVVQREFPEGIDLAPDEVSRRGFLGVIAASVALAGLTSCRKPKTHILPFHKRPEGFKPGVPSFYATTLTRGGYGLGVLVKSSDGRPTKIEGNPDHPSSLGGSDGRQQAELLQIYDPGRSKAARGPQPAHGTDDGHVAADGHGHAAHPVDRFGEFFEWWDAQKAKELVTKKGAGLHVLMAPTTSPSLLAMIGKTKETFPQAKFHFWEPLHRDEELAGAAAAFGRPVDTQHDFGKADVVVSLDSDFLALDGNALNAGNAWGTRRRNPRSGQPMTRLYVVEACYSTTGTAADHRFRVRGSDIAQAAFAIAAALGVGGDAAKAHQNATFQKNGKNWLPIVIRDLQAARGRGLVVAGPRQPRSVHAVVHAINAALDNVGKTVHYTATPEPWASLPKNSCVESLRELKAAIDQKQVDTLVCLGTNPVLDAPADLGFAAAMANVAHTVHVGLHEDETGQRATWHIPGTHELEAWGDAKAHDGTISLQQPLIAPLYGGLSPVEFLGLISQQPSYENLESVRDGAFGHDLVKQYWQAASGSADFDGWWKRALHDGVVAGTQSAPESVAVNANGVAAAIQWQAIDGFEVSLRPCPKMWDGRFANNSWMQEVPDPVTKLSWDNAALVSPATAKELGVDNGDLLSISAAGNTVQIPAWILPGHADKSVTIYLGWGRKLTEDCKVAKGTGFDGYPLRIAAAQWFATAQVQRASGSYKLVCTQEHGTMAGRDLAREADKATHDKDPEWAPKMSLLDKAARLKGKTEKDVAKSLWTERYDGSRKDPEVLASPYQWAMVIDLNACTGCSACVVACVAENNISMVGKVQVARNREMFWIRADRYFTSRAEDNLATADDPQVMNQPVPCMQCENAPCESVCPVAATTHSPDGLNDMVYNRCIGTRYCSNNCPYKVRRYNYLDYLGHVPDSKQLAYNPDVTVRSRGVMEKCTYCVQRINGARISAKLTKTTVGDGQGQIAVSTACAQACPTKAITFGDMKNPANKVAQLRGSSLNYGLLSDLNTKPRTTYLGRVRNPNPDLA